MVSEARERRLQVPLASGRDRALAELAALLIHGEATTRHRAWQPNPQATPANHGNCRFPTEQERHTGERRTLAATYVFQIVGARSGEVPG